MQTQSAPSTARPTGKRRRVSALLLAGVLTSALVPVATAGPAAAHDRLESTNPADGSTVDVAPSSVVLTMSSAPLALGTQVQVTGPDGVVSSGDPQIVDETVIQDVEGDLPAGSYEVQWRVTSSDGHPISGSFTFTSTTPAIPTGTVTVEPLPTVTDPSPSTSTSAETAETVDPSNPTSDDGNGALIGIAAAIVVIGAGAGGIIGYRRRQR